jgi:hypothetical protein
VYFRSIDFFSLIFWIVKERKKSLDTYNMYFHCLFIHFKRHIFLFWILVFYTISSAFDTYRVYNFSKCRRVEPIQLLPVQANEKFEDIRYLKDDWSRVQSETLLEQLSILNWNHWIILYVYLRFVPCYKSSLENILNEWL